MVKAWIPAQKLSKFLEFVLWQWGRASSGRDKKTSGIAHTKLASAPAHPFYQRLKELLEAEGLDEFVESRCAKFYAAKNGRPSLTPGIYFRSLLIGYFYPELIRPHLQSFC